MEGRSHNPLSSEQYGGTFAFYLGCTAAPSCIISSFASELIPQRRTCPSFHTHLVLQ